MAILAITQSLTHDKIELIVVNHTWSSEDQYSHALHGNNLFSLLVSVYPKGLPLHTRLYHGEWDVVNDITPESPEDIDEINRLTGRFFIVTYPAAAVPLWAVLAISIAVSLAVAFLMPLPQIPGGGNGQPPSPNNSLAQRTNRQRLGGRVPDIFGEVWSLPDMLAPSYSVYINHKEVEFSYMCIGRGSYNVTKAYDDTTPINQILGSTVLVFDPNKSLNDTPKVRFGADLTPDEAALSRLAVKRYTAVNGQVLAPPDNYLLVKGDILFKNPNIIETTSSDIDFTTQFAVGNKLLVEKATDLPSGNSVQLNGATVKYNLNGLYQIQSITKNQIILNAPASVASDWDTLNTNVDFAQSADVVLSTESQTLWQGWFYTDLAEHENVMINLRAPNGIYTSYGDEWVPIAANFEIESELVDSNSNFIEGTNVKTGIVLKSPNYDKYLDNNGNAWIRSSDDTVRQAACGTYFVNNPYFGKGKRLRWRIRRSSRRVHSNKGQVLQDIKLIDFFGVRLLNEVSKDVTTVYSKTLATEGALSVKERKLRLLVQRYVRNWQDNDNLILSNRVDDIIYDIVTDALTGGLTIDDINMPQLKAEIDNQIAYFGTDLCSQFCGTFDNTDVTTEEMVQTVAQSAFCQAYRFNNQINLHFEHKEPVSVVQFNAHNMLPGSFEYSESFGPRNNFDGVQVTYTDPVDDAKVTLNYPANGSATNPDKKELPGVRNKVQAHMHLMRQYQKNMYAYKTCSFSGADESGIIIPTNRIDAANLYQSDTRQGVVIQQSVNSNGQTVIVTNAPVGLSDGQTATIFVQTISGTVDNIRCTLGRHERELVLNRPPSQPLSLSPTAVVRATYKLVTHNELDRDAYLVTAKETGGNAMSHKLTCINYTDKYYQNDSDYLTQQITI